MINVANADIYDAALQQLDRYKSSIGRLHKGRFIQLFFGLKFYQNDLPSMFSGSFVKTEVFQTLLDDLYSKVNRPLDDCVLVLFENCYLARTGITALGHQGAQNTWRNNFNLQKGIGCYAPPQDLASNTFLNQNRVNCQYLSAPVLGSLSDANCTLCPTGATYRNEDHRKWLRIDPGGNGYAVVDLYNIQNFEPYVTSNGQRIPIIPLVIALYHDSSPALGLGNHQEINLEQFQDDFNFMNDEFNAYFDDDPENIYNSALCTNFPEIEYARISTTQRTFRPPAPTRQPYRVRRQARLIPTPVLTGTAVPPPTAINTGWNAEQFVAGSLSSNGWEITVVSRQQVGFDLYGKRGNRTCLFEVKSSVGACTPSFTSREWEQASRHGENYILAIIENFNPNQQNMIYWIPDPVNRCISREAQTIMYSISRNSWITATVPLGEL